MSRCDAERRNLRQFVFVPVRFVRQRFDKCVTRQRFFRSAKELPLQCVAVALTIRLDLCARRRDFTFADPIPDRGARFSAHDPASIGKKRADRSEVIE